MVQSAAERQYQDDIIRWELYDGYTKKAVTVHNRTGSTITSADVMGQPLRPDSGVATDYRFLMATEESYCNALLLHHGSFAVNTLANAATFKTKAIVRGPAIIDASRIPALDVAGGSLTAATLITALQALNPPIVCNTEQSPTVTQTT